MHGKSNSPELAAYKAKQPSEQSVNAILYKYAMLLKADGVTRVRIEFSGSGDSGQIDHIEYYTGPVGSVPMADNPFGGNAMDKSFMDMWYDVLDLRGWDVNNEGSQGHLVWDLDADSMSLLIEHNVVRVEEVRFEGADVLKGVALE